jgi:hypothetical protein
MLGTQVKSWKRKIFQKEQSPQRLGAKQNSRNANEDTPERTKVHMARISNKINKIKIYPRILMIRQTNMPKYKRIIQRIRNKRVTSHRAQNESSHKGGAHTNEQTKAHTRVTYSKWINKSSKAGNTDAHDENS